MQTDSVVSPGAPGSADLRISPTSLEDVLPEIVRLAKRVLEPRLKVQLPIASGRVWLGATICPFSNTSTHPRDAE